MPVISRRSYRTAGILCLLWLSACSPGDGEGDRADSLRSAEPSSRASINEPFVVGIRQVGEIFDPTTVLPAEVSAVAYNIYDWLFDRHFDGKVKPGLADSWELSPDARNLTIRLRQDVRFHTGEPMTSADVVFSWNRLVEGGFSTRVARSLRTIEAVEPHTVHIGFDRPEIGFVPFGGIPILSKAYHEASGEQRFREQPVGTGPYRFKSLARGQYVDLERFEDYWGPLPEISRARLKFVTEDTTRVAQLLTGEADLIMQVPFPLAPQVANHPNLRIVELKPGGMTVFLAMKTDNPQTPWADRRVREAIALAIDHEAIVKDILLGYPEHYPFLAPGDLGYDPELTPYAFDPEKARQLLAEAGVEKLGFEIPYISGATTGQKETAEAVALYLNNVGIDARAKPIEGPQFIRWVQQASRNPEMDYVALFIGGVAGRAEPSTGLATHFATFTPFAWYQNPEVNELALIMASTPDEEARAEAIRALGKAVHADMRYIPLWTNSHLYGMKSCVEFAPTLGEYDIIMLRDVSIAGCATPAGNGRTRK